MSLNTRIFKTSFLFGCGAIFGFALCFGYIREESQKPVAYVSPIIQREGYTLSYDTRHRNPNWVYEHLTPNRAIDKANDRSKLIFIQDPLVPEELQAHNEDFHKSGFDRGHNCPAADWQDENMKETFYLINISPQLPQFNRSYWKKFENYIRALVEKYEALHVFTGPLYMPYQETDGKWYVKYQVIGEGRVAVPTHFFKVIFAQNFNGSVDSFAYIMPSAFIDPDTPFDHFSVKVNEIQKASGTIFGLDLIE